MDNKRNLTAGGAPYLSTDSNSCCLHNLKDIYSQNPYRRTWNYQNWGNQIWNYSLLAWIHSTVEIHSSYWGPWNITGRIPVSSAGEIPSCCFNFRKRIPSRLLPNMKGSFEMRINSGLLCNYSADSRTGNTLHAYQNFRACFLRSRTDRGWWWSEHWCAHPNSDLKTWRQ